MRWSMPRIHTGRSQIARALSAVARTTAVAPSEIGGRSCLRSGAVKYGSFRSTSTSGLPFTWARGLLSALRRLRTTISAISRSVILPASINARACMPASDTGSAPSGVSVYGSIWSG